MRIEYPQTLQLWGTTASDKMNDTYLSNSPFPLNKRKSCTDKPISSKRSGCLNWKYNTQNATYQTNLIGFDFTQP